MCGLNPSLVLEQHLEEIQGQREHVGVVVLSRDAVEGLEVTQLQGSRGFVHHISCLTQLPGCTLLTLGRDHLIKWTGQKFKG